MTRRGSKQQGPNAERKALQERLDRFREQRSGFAGKPMPPAKAPNAAHGRGPSRQRRG
jgi:hypothetical protein